MAEKLAFCPLLGGSCDKPYDCYLCPKMHQYIAQQPFGQAYWVCPSCIRELAKKAKEEGKSIKIAGYYTEGQCQYVGCTRPPRIEYGDGNDTDAGWTEADIVERPGGYSKLLQLVVGDINS